MEDISRLDGVSVYIANGTEFNRFTDWMEDYHFIWISGVQPKQRDYISGGIKYDELIIHTNYHGSRCISRAIERMEKISLDELLDLVGKKYEFDIDAWQEIMKGA